MTIPPFLRAHWPIPAALALGVLLGWQLFHPRQPAVHEKLDEHAQAKAEVAVEQRKDVGGWSRSTYEYAQKATAPEGAVGLPGHPPKADLAASPDTIPPHGDLVKLIVERHDPTVIATHSTEVVQAAEDRHLDLTITPAPAPGWAVQAGLEDVLHARTLRIAARRRIVGPFWVELAVSPASRGVGVAGAVEW